MSISGYVRDNYSYTVEGVTDSPLVTATVTITPNKCEDEIKVPCIVPRLYNLEFSLNLNEKLRRLLPGALDPKIISLEFYEGETEISAQHNSEVARKRKEFITVSTNAITGHCLFTTPQFRTTENKTFLYIALKVHKVVIKYLVCDLAVFTNSSQITKNYELVLAGDHVQGILQNCFWHKDATFITKKEADAARKMQNEPAPIPAERKSLHEIVLATEDALANLKELLYSKEAYAEEAVTAITRTLVSAISKPPMVYKTPPESPNSHLPSLFDLPTNFEDILGDYKLGF